MWIFSATDKVALLIGNDDYMNETQLKAPKNDVYLMAEKFRSLDFKVVSLLNLTKIEMLAAIREFVLLLGKGNIKIWLKYEWWDSNLS